MQGPRLHDRVVRFVLLLSTCAFLLLPFAQGQSGRSSSSINPYNVELARLKAALVGAATPEQAVILARVCALREYVDSVADVDNSLADVAADPNLNRLVRDEALRHLVATDINTGKLTKARETVAKLGFARQWSIAGPFPAMSAAASAASDADTAPVTHAPLNWKAVGPTGPGLWLDLADFFSYSGESIVYAATSVYSEKPENVALRFGSDSALAIFVNGQKTFLTSYDSQVAFDQYSVSVVLQPGWNSILLKLVRKVDGPWRFGVRITRPEGGGMVLDSSASHRPTDRLAAAGTAALPKPDDLLDMAEAAVRSDPTSAERLETLGLLEQERGHGLAFDHLESAARLAPTAERWLAVARSCPDSSCKFNALNSGVQSDSRSGAAKLALADYYFDRNQLDKSRDLLREAIALAPWNLAARSRLIDVYVSAGLTDLALHDTRALLHDFPGPLWLRRRAGSRFTDLGLFDEALALLGSALGDDFAGSRERSLLVRIYQRRHDSQNIERLYEEQLELNPHDTDALAHLAELYCGDGDFAKAELTMRAAIETNPASDQLHELYANILARAGHVDAATAQLAHAVQLNPHLERARQKLQLSKSAGQADAEDKYVEDAAELATRANCASSPISTNATAVADVRIERMYPNGLASIRTQQDL